MPQLNFTQELISLLNFLLTGVIILKLINSNFKIKCPVAGKPLLTQDKSYYLPYFHVAYDFESSTLSIEYGIVCGGYLSIIFIFICFLFIVSSKAFSKISWNRALSLEFIITREIIKINIKIIPK